MTHLAVALFSLALLAAPRAAAAQPAGKAARIGFLGAETASDDARRMAGLRAGLRDLGYVEGRDIVIEGRWAEGHYDRLPDLAAELIRLKVDVLVAAGIKAVVGASRATATVPIVMTSAGDVVALGLVASLARPGGNITGSTNLSREIGSKRLEFLKEAAPRILRSGYFVNPASPTLEPKLQTLGTMASSLKLELHVFEARGPHELDRAFSEMAKRRMSAVVVQDDTLFVANVRTVVDLATRSRLPSAGNLGFAEAGGLIGYQQNLRDLDRRAAIFVDKILKGAKPADLPIEQPTKFHLVINLKTAKALGLTVPPSVLSRADEIIQ